MKVIKRDQREEIKCTVNGALMLGEASPRLLLSDFLRDQLSMTGVHVGCEHGVCGACTVLIKGKPVRSCLMFAVQVEGAEIDTVEGLSANENTLSELQQAFRRHHALQCGFCTSGILISAQHLLDTEQNLSESRVRDVLSGHICRCTGYQGIIDAVMEVSKSLTAKQSNTDSMEIDKV